MSYTWEDFVQENKRWVVDHLTVEEKANIIRNMSPETRLKGLTPETRLKGLSPETRLKGLSPKAVLQGLSKEEREALKALLAYENDGSSH